MSLLSRFFGRAEPPARGGQARLVANPTITNPPALQVLLGKQSRTFSSAAEPIRRALVQLAPKAANVQCQLDPGAAREGNALGLLGWDQHVVRMIGFDLPMPEDAVEACVAPAHYGAALKDVARAHRGHILLFYAGGVESTSERYLALATAAAALVSVGATTVLNESARTSAPVQLLVDAHAAGTLAELPLLLLFCGFVKYEVEGVRGVWMRTYNVPAFGVPDLAVLAAGHHEGELWFGRFSTIIEYLAQSGAALEPGHTMQVDASCFLRFHAPAPAEYFLDGPGRVLVAETISADAVNT